MKDLLKYFDLFGGFPRFRPISHDPRDRDTRSPELVDYLKERAEAKRQRRRDRNLRNVMRGGFQQ